MHRSPVISPPQVLIFDTGPLRELVTYSAVQSLHFESLRGELLHLKTEVSYQKVARFIGGFRKKTTTPHVVAEISSWIRGLGPKRASVIWEIVYTEFRWMRMDEALFKLLDMPKQLVADIGAADVSVLQLALTFPPSDSVVFSIDRKLIEECKEAGRVASNLWEVIAAEV